MKPIIIANWKMNLNLDDAFSKTSALNKRNSSAQFILAPPTPYLAYLAKNCKKTSFCAQDVSDISGYGAYTGESSANIIKSCDVNYAIIGHSEKRTIMKDSNMTVRKKAENCIKAGITPIICIGETLESRKNNNYREFILEQISESIPDNATNIIIAYEPIWAIGTGILPTTEELSDIFDFIKNNSAISQVARNAQLVYGGSVNSRNYKEIISIKGVSGVLIGGASLDDDELNSILD
jgi:triosephosphate isomerase